MPHDDTPYWDMPHDDNATGNSLTTKFTVTVLLSFLKQKNTRYTVYVANYLMSTMLHTYEDKEWFSLLLIRQGPFVFF
jgi:hypothetical protein